MGKYTLDREGFPIRFVHLTNFGFGGQEGASKTARTQSPKTLAHT